MKIAQENGIRKVRIRSESQLVVEQVTSRYEAKDDRMKRIPEGRKNDVTQINNRELVSWMDEIRNYLELNRLPEESHEARTGQKKFLIVAVDYFSKCIEAEPVARINESAMIQFVLKNILCCFGIPRKITSDNGTQFQGKQFRSWCAQWKIRQVFTSVGNPKANGQTEAYRTTPRNGMGETPFSLIYGSEALIPTKVVEPTSRVVNYEEQRNDEARRLDLDLVEERRDMSRMRLENYKQRILCNYNSHVKERTFQIGELVLRKVEVQKPIGRLEPKWEGPYRITEIRREGTYKLTTLEGQEIPQTWSIQNLKKYHY
ncbi:UNVERIFIED_CONTAM: hypothetical protein Sradi_0478500 [Sesamum radiatum]|uniref:Integrase catalytic domain-containing protein n=1 Tax=Sesamum radiatum TaxID=300843 RepID=A0AAW2W8X3_SESRA